VGGKREPVGGEEGFSTLEMVVALAVLSVTMLAAGPFFVNSLTNVNRQRTRQAAIQLAETAMEQVRGLKGSALLTGRSVTANQAQVDAAPAVVLPYLSTMQVVGDPMITDPASTAGADAPIPTSAQQLTVERTTYTQNLYVGECEVYLTGTSECIYPKGAGAPADTTQILQFFRVVVLESWPDAHTCGNTGGICSYVATTLVSRASEPTFDFNRPAPQVMNNNQTWYVGDTVLYQMKARGGQLPNTWTIATSLAGLGLSFDPSGSGMITGTATTAGVVNTTATVTDHLNRNNTGPVTFTVVKPPTVTVPPSVTSYVGSPANPTLSATGGVAPYSWGWTGFPPGLTLNATTGAITGSPTAPGVYTVTVTVTDANQRTGTATYPQTVYPAITLSGLSDQTIDLNTRLDLTAVAGGGDGSYTYAGSGLPPGVLVNRNTGAVAGKSTASGRFLATVTVADGSGGTASFPFVVVVTTSSSLVFTAPSVTAPDQTTARNTNVSLRLTTNVPGAALSVTGLPSSLTFDASSGTISGRTPATAGSYTVIATATTSTTSPPSTSILTFTWKIT
jgi:type II secretory pathway pseudopilin PulG